MMRRHEESDGWTSAISRFLVMRSRSAYRPHHVWLTVLFGVCVELGLIPALIVIGGIRIDRAFGWPPLLPQAWVPFGAAGCFAIGVPWLAWSIIWQHWRGQGTPLPLVPTKRCLTTGPYRYTRNPMSLGAMFWLAGWALLSNSRAALLGGVGGFIAAVLTYIRVVEERELAARFGREYLDYRARTPFLIPGLPGHD